MRYNQHQSWTIKRCIGSSVARQPYVKRGGNFDTHASVKKTDWGCRSLRLSRYPNINDLDVSP